jgi:hypothetical protein
MGFLRNHAIDTASFPLREGLEVSAYKVVRLMADTLEEMAVQAPVLQTEKFSLGNHLHNYVYVPVHQFKSSLIVMAFEPRSMVGLVNYTAFAYLLEAGKLYPILRVE